MRQFLIYVSCAFLFVSCQKQQQEVIRTSYYHSYGPQISSAEWKKQGSTGDIAVLRSDGVEERRAYVDGVLQGTSTWTYPHSKVVERYEEYAQGRKVASGHNFSNGSPETEEETLSKNDTMVRRWYEDGAPLSLEHFIGDKLFEAQYYNDDGVLESCIANGSGVKVFRSPQGVLLFREQIDHGQMVAKEQFHANGVVQEVCYFKDGKREGVRKSFDETGRPLSVETYQNDLLNGPAVYFKDGLKESSFFYVDGIKDGKEQHFHPDSGIVIEETIWIAGERHGQVSKQYDGMTILEWYWRGVPVTEAQFKKNDETVKASQNAKIDSL